MFELRTLLYTYERTEKPKTTAAMHLEFVRGGGGRVLLLKSNAA